jgi:hypothetical protein
MFYVECLVDEEEEEALVLRFNICLLAWTIAKQPIGTQRHNHDHIVVQYLMLGT